MGTGVGEAMLLGAAVGGGSAAITGGDPLKGALLGGLTGGVGSGISGALGGAAGAEAGTLAGTAGTAGGTGLQTASTLGMTAPTASGITALPAGGLAPVDYGLSASANAVPNVAANAAGMTPGTGLMPPSMSTAGGPSLFSDPTAYIKAHPYMTGASAMAGALGGREAPQMPGEYDGPLKRFRFNPESWRTSWMAEGGIASLPGYDRVVGEDAYPQSMASGGISDLGSYSDGGRMLRGRGDGMSDSIPATIGGRRPARLADGEFVVPADVVSHLGNGSTDAGAKQLYSMMDKVRKARTGTKKQGREINPRKYMPA